MRTITSVTALAARRAPFRWWATASVVLMALLLAASAAVAKPRPQPPPNNHVSRLAKEMGPPRRRGHSRLAHLASAWSVTLTAGATSLWPEQSTTLAATVSPKVSGPDWIGIWNATTGKRVVTCGNTTSCRAAITEPTAQTDLLFAEVMDGSTEVTDDGLSVTWKFLGQISLSASPSTVEIGRFAQPGQAWSSRLTATTAIDVGPTPFSIEVYDVTTGKSVALCSYGTTCSTVVSMTSATTQEHVAYIADDSTGFPPSGIQATSNDSYVTWTTTGWTISLTAPTSTEGPETVTATANQDVGPTPYYIEIFDESTGRMIGECATGATCSISYVPNMSELVAFVSPYSTALPPVGAVASSNVVESSSFIP